MYQKKNKNMKNYVKLFESWLNEAEESQTAQDDAKKFIEEMSTKLTVSDIKSMDRKSLGWALAEVFGYIGLARKNKFVRFDPSTSGDFEGFDSTPISRSDWAIVKLREDTDNIKEKDTEPALNAKIINVTMPEGTYYLSMKEILNSAVMAYVGNVKVYVSKIEKSSKWMNGDAEWDKSYAILTGKDAKGSQMLANKIGYNVGNYAPAEFKPAAK